MSFALDRASSTPTRARASGADARRGRRADVAFATRDGDGATGRRERMAKTGKRKQSLGPRSIDRASQEDDGRWVEYFVLASKAREDEATPARWFPLGDVAFVVREGTHVDVDDVIRERYWILNEFARVRHVALNVGRGDVVIGVRAQRGPMHARAKNATDVVRVCDESTALEWDSANDVRMPYGKYPATLKLLNNAPQITAALKTKMLSDSARFAGAQTNASNASELS